ncbi:hypothetical protein [Caldimonas thermodepolymerans]|uniref:hypothetical protein n=1 Tax=Caldimonas thermodepolymerans TaxID=215580 RepID=UPI002490CE76|nr:hypothetical protein [Caldimonas thermodepolymerans]
MTLIKGRLKPAKESASRRHDRICVSLFEQADQIVPWVSSEHSKLVGWQDNFEWGAPQLEYPILKPGRGSRDPRTIGYVDMLCFGEMQKLKSCMLFEVKPEILSLGELLRQVHRYKECITRYCGVCDKFDGLLAVAVVSASNQYADVLREHGIVFVDTAWLREAA